LTTIFSKYTPNVAKQQRKYQFTTEISHGIASINGVILTDDLTT
jgi:hypothetical protein